MARYNEEKSYYKAFIMSYGILNRSTSLLNQTGAGDGVKRIPFGFSITGSYNILNGKVGKSQESFYWVSLIASKEESRRFYYSRTYFHTTGGTPVEKGYGYSVRCVAKCGGRRY